ncbi:ribonuclease HII [Lederbergia sp. NSJ-179]|uniref:ribonuclease HII n=1 Tax=Lederbergia sp. NSJ-179 TaxID=2931402 RepID=UPI001FCFB4A2|nr:ribonuclease HII [Lederbergia sp. NSJ-179]MCJ7839623.1 ribonuclease HII [Lederbergia sp. NSJ-179]
MKTLSIAKVEQILKHTQDEEDPILMDLKADRRKGIQTLLRRWYKQKEQEKKDWEHYQSMSTYEKQARQMGYHFIVGIDEVGRGPLAGPVVSAAVILPENHYIFGLNDSKKLTANKRNQLYQQIMDHAISVGIGMISSEEIDQLNIFQATKKSMLAALQNLQVKPDFLLIDAIQLESIYPELPIVKGDMYSVSIAAASIVAKVTRDQLMTKYHSRYPEYGFQEHKGYGTKKHLEALKQFGPCPIHRTSFEPIKSLLKERVQKGG